MGQLESLRELSIAQPIKKKKKTRNKIKYYLALVVSIDKDSNDF
jgi:hypothetical protein